MKTTFASIVGLLLLATLLPAQDFLPPSLLAHQSAWPAVVRQQLQPYQEADAAANAKNFQNKNMELQLDSTIGSLTYHVGGGNFITVPQSRGIHTYPAWDLENIVEYVRDDNGGWRLYARTTIRRDELSRLLTTLAENWDEEVNAFVPDSRLRAYPFATHPSLLDSFYVEGYSFETNGWVRLLTVRNTISKAGLLEESLTTMDFDGLLLTFRDEYTYDNTGNNTLIESYLIDGPEETLVGIQEMSYFDGLLLSETASITDGQGGFLPEGRTTYKYNNDNLADTVSGFEWDYAVEDWRLSQGDFYEYDEEQRLSAHEVIFYYDFGTTERQRFTYTYVQDLYTEVETSYYFDLDFNTFFPHGRKQYYYQEVVVNLPGEPVVQRSLFLWPNPALDQVWVKGTEGSSGDFQLFNMNGQLVRSGRWLDLHESLPVADLPSGSYVLRLSGPQMWYTGTLIKQ